MEADFSAAGDGERACQLSSKIKNFFSDGISSLIMPGEGVPLLGG